jgi:hypothetical protein
MSAASCPQRRQLDIEPAACRGHGQISVSLVIVDGQPLNGF